MTTTDLSDLYSSELDNGRTLLTTRLSSRAHDRYQQALWYCWGRQDAGDEATTNRAASAHYLGDDFAFAEYAALEAETYVREQTCMLACIPDQYRRFVSELSTTEATR